jgi:hypothetical protein
VLQITRHQNAAFFFIHPLLGQNFVLSNISLNVDVVGIRACGSDFVTLNEWGSDGTLM